MLANLQRLHAWADAHLFFIANRIEARTARFKRKETNAQHALHP